MLEFLGICWFRFTLTKSLVTPGHFKWKFGPPLVYLYICQSLRISDMWDLCLLILRDQYQSWKRVLSTPSAKVTFHISGFFFFQAFPPIFSTNVIKCCFCNRHVSNYYFKTFVSLFVLFASIFASRIHFS